MAMGCTNHLTPNPNCAACQLKTIGRDQRESAQQAHRANDLQAQANARAIQYAAEQAESAEEAAWHAEMALAAAERQSTNTASYEFSMWRQSADGQTWNAWAVEAEDWMNRARGHDQALLPYWKEAAAPGWDSDAAKKAHQRAENIFSWSTTAAVGCFIGAIVGIVVQWFTSNTLIWVLTQLCKWGFPIFLVASIVLHFTGAKQRRPLAQQALNSRSAKAFEQTYGANPFKNSQALPSWRPGMTCAQATAFLNSIAAIARPETGFYPRPDQLPALPELRVRDLSEWPPVVAEGARKHFEVS